MLSQALKIAVLAAFAQIAEGHVRALPTGIGCRDCNGKATAGPFRVNGPLGRVKAFGANGVEVVKPGDVVELAIGYNGGHKSQTLNFFNVRYACGIANLGTDNTFKRIGPQDKNTINCNAPCKQLTSNQIETVDGAPATANNYPIDATASKQSGYKVTFKIPEVQGTEDARKCTFALVEGRDWGAAWDFQVQEANDPPPPTPAPAPPVSVQGTYDFTAANCQNDAPNCACLAGYVAVQHQAGTETAKLSLNMPGYPTQVIDAKGKNGAWTVQYTLSTCGKPDEQIDISLAKDNAPQATGTILNLGVISDDPKVCGSIVKSGNTNKQFNPTNIPAKCPQCTDKPGWVDGHPTDPVGCAGYTTCDGAKWRTKAFDHYKKWAKNGVSAREACCGCGGGDYPNPTPAPTPPPAQQPPAQQTPPAQQPPAQQTPPAQQPPAQQTPPAGTVDAAGIWGNNRAVDSASGMDIAFGAVVTVFASVLM